MTSTNEYPVIRLAGRIILNFEIETLSGLHIGGAAGTLAIGNVDNPVIRNPFTNEPYVPGSSLRGKMRSQLEKVLGAEQNTSIGKGVYIHTADSLEHYKTCDVCRIFGAAGKKPEEPVVNAPTRLIIRDAGLNSDWRTLYSTIRTDLPFTEVKWEAAIDRVTSAATPRQQERVPAGAVFDGSLTFSLYHSLSSDMALFDTVLDGLQLVEDDYLGGQGARGSGQVRFRQFTLTFKPTGGDEQTQQVADLPTLRTAWSQMHATLR